MSLACPSRALRTPLSRVIRQMRSRNLTRPHGASCARLASSARQPRSTLEPLDAVSVHRLEAERRAYHQRRSYYAAAGAATCMLASLVVVSFMPKEQNDARPNDPLNAVPISTAGAKDHIEDSVPTGTSTIPTFPKTIALPDDSAAALDGKIEYQLVGLGVRSVSFLGIQVYVVGLYVATEDVALLQKSLIRTLDPVATTLIKTEKDKLRNMLVDPDSSSAVWSRVLKDTHLRSALRIVPTRNTDFQHLRDGWVRGITARAQSASRAGDAEFEDDAFGKAMQDFKGVFSGGARKNVPKAKTMLLMRSQLGALTVWYDEPGKPEALPLRLGDVADERISRLIWMTYLAGKNVASEPARRSVVDGVMDFVERPVGTVATQVT